MLRLDALVKATLCLAISTCVVALASSEVIAHPFHICVGQMNWNQEQGHWEVSLRFHPQDLEQSLQKWKLAQSRAALDSGTPVDVVLAGCRVEDAEFEKQVVGYLQAQFFLRRAPAAMTQEEVLKVLSASPREASDFSRLVWVGKEHEKAWLWVHLEMHPPENDVERHSLWLCHKALIGDVTNQENSVVVERSRRNKFSLQFKEGTLLQRFQKP